MERKEKEAVVGDGVGGGYVNPAHELAHDEISEAVSGGIREGDNRTEEGEADIQRLGEEEEEAVSGQPLAAVVENEPQTEEMKKKAEAIIRAQYQMSVLTWKDVAVAVISYKGMRPIYVIHQGSFYWSKNNGWVFEPSYLEVRQNCLWFSKKGPATKKMREVKEALRLTEEEDKALRLKQLEEAKTQTTAPMEAPCQEVRTLQEP